jgi:hypothetical protein
MTWQAAAQRAGDSGLFEGGLSWGTVVLGVLGVLALVAVCTFGILARLRDRAADQKSLEALRAERSARAEPNGEDAAASTG